MTVTKQYLERRVRDLNEWLQNHPKTHKDYNLKKNNIKYYVHMLTEMDELGLEQTELKLYKQV